MNNVNKSLAEDAICGLGMLAIILPDFLKKRNFEGLGEEDAKEVCLHLKLAIKALKGLDEHAAYRALGTVEELTKMKQFAGCGCSICLAHNGMVCPRMDEKPPERSDGE